MENKLEESLRRSIRNDIIMKNQMRAPICYEAERMLDEIVKIEMENTKYNRDDRPSFYAWGDYD